MRMWIQDEISGIGSPNLGSRGKASDEGPARKDGNVRGHVHVQEQQAAFQCREWDPYLQGATCERAPGT